MLERYRFKRCVPVPPLASEQHTDSKYNPEKSAPFHLLTRQEYNILHCNGTVWDSEILPQLLVLRKMGKAKVTNKEVHSLERGMCVISPNNPLQSEFQ